MKYRKKPVVIEAFQLNDRGMVAEDWFWDAVSANRIITRNFGKNYTDPAQCEISTLEGVMTAKSGDYIIRGVQGEIYPCKPDIFEQTYEKVEGNSEFENKEAKIAKAVAATGLSEQQIRQMISNGKMPMGPWIALMKEEQG